MVKWALIFILLFAGYTVLKAQAQFTEQTALNRSGRPIVRIISHVNYTAYCVIWNDDETYFKDWDLLAGSSSKWYLVPDGDWHWHCE